MRVVEFVTFAGKAVGRNDLEVEVLVLSFGRRALMSDCREGAGGSRARVTLARAKSPRMATNRSVDIFSYSDIYPTFLHCCFE